MAASCAQELGPWRWGETSAAPRRREAFPALFRVRACACGHGVTLGEQLVEPGLGGGGAVAEQEGWEEEEPGHRSPRQPGKQSRPQGTSVGTGACSGHSSGLMGEGKSRNKSKGQRLQCPGSSGLSHSGPGLWGGAAPPRHPFPSILGRRPWLCEYLAQVLLSILQC